MLWNRRDEWHWQHNLHREQATEVLHRGLINWHIFTLSDEFKSIPCSENVRLIYSLCPWKHLLKHVCNNKQQWSVPQQPVFNSDQSINFKSVDSKAASLLGWKPSQTRHWFLPVLLFVCTFTICLRQEIDCIVISDFWPWLVVWSLERRHFFVM